MKYILDSSVAFKWLVPEADTDKALKLRDDYRRAAHELLAPDILLVEVTHALTRAERQNRVTSPQGALLFVDLLNTAPALVAHVPRLPRAYKISSQLRIGVYDCLYLALSEQESCDVITGDAYLATAAKGYPVVLLADLP
jgi:predicted nucleic acid-binding protein